MAETTVIKRPHLPLVAKLRQKWVEIYKVRWPYWFISPFYILFFIFQRRFVEGITAGAIKG
jgi:hypothetical protein